MPQAKPQIAVGADVEAVLAIRPEPLVDDGPPSLSPSQAFLQEAAKGRAALAADAFLCRSRPGSLGSWLTALKAEMAGVLPGSLSPGENLRRRRFLYEALLELGFALGGRDAGELGHGEGAAQALDRVKEILAGQEREEAGLPNGAGLGRRIVERLIATMKSVNAGDSLVGLIAEEAEKEMTAQGTAGPCAFLEAYVRKIRASVYWRLVENRWCKFGNDYARGLDHLRRLGFVQVSTNPVLAAKAFDEDPELLAQFRQEAARRPEWKSDPDRHGDEMAMAATLLALWPNLTVFRPLGVRAGNLDYMVSFQLNPNIADNAKLSLEDAEKAYRIASDFLARYDTHALPAEEAARKIGPNMVFKVAAGAPAAREITRSLNAKGMGTNNTVVYTVAQEVRLILDAFEGKAAAIKAGLGITRTYETNMGGRLVSHLREAEAEKILAAVAVKEGEAEGRRRLSKLAEAIGVDEKTRGGLAADPFPKAAAKVAAFKFLKALDHPAFLEAARGAGPTDAALAELEAAIKKAGTLVVRRVYRIFFDPKNRGNWTSYLSKTYGVSVADAGRILDSMDCLPASKRIPEDTFHTLGYPNQCNTEFPNHARAVELASRKPGFRLDDHKASLFQDYDEASVRLLLTLPDFVKAYELTPELRKIIAEDAGISAARGHGERGIGPQDWSCFGSVVKTLTEFKAAYDGFVKKLAAAARG